MDPLRLKLHLTALVLNLTRDPFQYSEPYGDDCHRAIDTRDYFRDEGGLVLSAFVVLHPRRRVAEIMWIEKGSLPTEDGQDEEEEDEEYW